MSKVLVIGASGFLGGRIVRELISQGHAVRCLARDPEKIRDLVAAGCEASKGDISDAESVKQALKSLQAVYIAIHTISQQPGSRGAYRSVYPGATRRPCQFSRGHALFFRTVPSANTLVR